MNRAPDRSGEGVRATEGQGRRERGLNIFREWMACEFPSIRVEFVEDNESAVRDSDIVTYCTTSGGSPENYPTLKREWVKPGAYLAMPSSVGLDDELLADDVRIVVDNLGLYEAWSDEFPYPTYESIPIVGCFFTDRVHEGKLAAERIEDIGRIIAAGGTERDPDQIVIFSIGGMPVEDVAWATRVYERARTLGIGTSLNLWTTPVLA